MKRQLKALGLLLSIQGISQLGSVFLTF